MSECIAAFITIISGIRQFPDTETVEDDQQDLLNICAGWG